MRNILFAAAVIAAASGLDIGAAHAQNYPFCLKEAAGPGDCRYTTYQQCMASAAHTGRFCQLNTWLQFDTAAGYGPGNAYGYAPPPRPRYYGPNY